MILLGGAALRRPGLEAASRIAAATGARLLCETFPARLERGAGLPGLERLAYLAEFAQAQLAGTTAADPGGRPRPGVLLRLPGPAQFPGAGRLPGAHPGRDRARTCAGRWRALAERVAPGARPQPQPAQRPALPGGELTAETAAAVIGALLPEGAIVSDEANTSGLSLPAATAGAPPHDWLTLTGGAIGQGLPVATGAAVACPDRSVLALDSDGSAMYTIQALWTQAREQLDVTTVIFSNRRYAILDLELQRVGAVAGGRRGPQPARPVPPRPGLRCPGPRDGSPGGPGRQRRGVRGGAAARAGRAGPAPDRGAAQPAGVTSRGMRRAPAGIGVPGRGSRVALSGRSSRGREEGRCDRNQV